MEYKFCSFSIPFQANKKPASKSSARGSSSSNRSASKSSKRSYSAESLLSNEKNEFMVMSMDQGSNVDIDSKHHHFNKPSDFGWNLGVDQVKAH